MVKISLSLSPPYNGDFYSSNDAISGSVSVKLNKSVSIKQINVRLKGFTQTLTKIDGDNIYSQSGMMAPAQDNRSVHTLLEVTERVFPPDNVWDALEGSSKPFKVNPGTYEYKFNFPKFPKKPNCINRHIRDIDCFVKRSEATLPPSFNNKWQELHRIDNIDLYFYSFGKVLYFVQVQIELGKATSWYKPFDKFLTETQGIEFIPQVKDLLYAIDDNFTPCRQFSRKTNSMHGNPQKTNIISGAHQQTSFCADSMPGVWQENESIPPSSESSNEVLSIDSNVRFRVPHTLYKSSYRVQLPDEISLMWLEIKSRGFKQTYRRDFLFRHGCNKFDNIHVILSGKLAEIRKTRIIPVKLQLNLLESTIYLSQGIANENISSLKLIEIENLMATETDSFFRLEESVISMDDSKNGWGKVDCELRLKDHSILKRLRFNKEDYRHRGNRLYSFKTCTIKRTFRFQLLIDWKVNERIRQTENIIDNAQIFCHVREKINTVDTLPRYVEPPVYTEVSHERSKD